MSKARRAYQRRLYIKGDYYVSRSIARWMRRLAREIP